MKILPKYQLMAAAALIGIGFSAFAQEPAAGKQETSNENTAEGFDDFKQQLNADFDTYRQQLDREFTAYKDIVARQTKEYSGQVAEVWDQVELSSGKVWIDYSEDLTTKNRVDFENKTIKIAVTKRDATAADDNAMRSRLRDLLTRDQAQAFERDKIAQAVEAQSLAQLELLETAEVQPTPILLPLVSDNPTPSDKEIDRIVDAMMAKKSTTKASNSQGETVVSLEVPLIFEKPVSTAKAQQPSQEASSTSRKAASAPQLMADLRLNKLPKPAQLIHSFVTSNAQKSQLDTELVFAIIETESAFNPMATSPIPAYGLMQIVPESAGIDATKQLFGKGRILLPSYLYSREKNIEIGATYLNILFYRYLKDIKDPTSRLYCVIAAYNTGSGNVARAFKGKMRVRSALPVINNLSPDEVYSHLVKNLPYAETQKYLEKVVNRISKYQIN